MKTLISALALLLIPAAPVSAQGLKWPLVVFAAGATADQLSTAYSLHANPRTVEGDPLYAWAGRNMPLIAVAAASVDVLTVLLAARLHAQHPRLAVAGLYIAGGLRLFTAAQNISVAHQNALLPH